MIPVASIALVRRGFALVAASLLVLPGAASSAFASDFSILAAEGDVRVRSAEGDSVEGAPGATIGRGHALLVGEGRVAIAHGDAEGTDRTVILVGPESRLQLLDVEGDEATPMLHLHHGRLRLRQAIESSEGAAQTFHLLAGPREREDGVARPAIQVRGGDVMLTWNGEEQTGVLATQRGEVRMLIGSRRIVFRPMTMRDLRLTGPAGARSIGPGDWATMVDPLSIEGVSLPGVAALAGGAAAPAADSADAFVYYRMETTLGSFVLELNNRLAPISTANFIHYADTGFYEGTIFHRVVRSGIRVVQGGGFTQGMQVKRTDRQPIANEWRNGLPNARGSIAMARLASPDSATSQFYINTSANVSLDRPDARGAAYAVFGQVVSGMDVVDAIQAAPTAARGRHQDVPAEDIVITRVVRLTDEEVEELNLPRPRGGS